MLALRKALAALFLVFATVAFALTPGERVVLFSGIKPVWQANFLGASSLPAGLTWTVPTTLRTLYDSTGKLTYGGNNLILQSQTLSTSPWSTGGVSTLTPGITAPDGTSTAFQITYLAGGSRITQQIASIPAPSLIYSVYLKVASVDNGATLLVYDNTAGSTLTSLTVNTIAGSGIDAGNGWRRVYLALSPIVGHNLTFYVYTDKSNGAIVGSSLYAWGAQVEAVTYQTTPSAYNATTSAAYYGPRFDYDPSTLAPRGLLVEEQRVQSLTYSSIFSNSAWTVGNGTSILLTSGQSSLDGTNSAFLATANGNFAAHEMYETISVSNTPYSYSLYAKNNSVGHLRLQFASSGAGNGGYAEFDLSNGTIHGYGNLGTGTNTSASMVSVGNGWYRCVLVTTPPATTVYPDIAIQNSSWSGNYTAAGESIYIYGAQAEAGSFPTSYIPNPTSSTITRTADVVQFNGVPLAALQGAQGSFFVQTTDTVASGGGVSMGLLGSQDTSSLPLYYTSTGTISRTWNGSSVLDYTPVTAATTTRTGVAWSPAGRSITANGGAVVSDTAAFLRVAMSTGYLGNQGNNALWLNGHFASLAIYNARLPDPTLKAKSVVGAPY